jgi:UDP-N-acetylmuramate--alanine ligase
MNNLNNIRNIYFLGIGGIGMSALARYFNAQGKKVAGYDRTSTHLTRLLEHEGMTIHYSDDMNSVPGEFRDKENTLVVFTPAVPSDHKEFTFFRDNGFTIKKRAEVLGLISKTKDVIAISGTHGKTTTSTMTAHLLKQSHLDCSAFLGGISQNYQSNLLLSSSSNWVVAEADEYDRSFLHLHPKQAVVTAMDADHLDIYGTHEEVKKAFWQFISQIRDGGALVIKNGLSVGKPGKIDVFTYELSGKADFCVEKIAVKDGLYVFDLNTPFGKLTDLKLGFPGLLNVENSIAAIAMALIAGVKNEEIYSAIQSFKGVQRRFDFHIKHQDFMMIDDYGHHPEELRYTIQSVKDLYPGKKVLGIFQPHLYSRTQDFAAEFAGSLDLLDNAILLDIYPARELPIPGVTSAIILDKMRNKNKMICTKQELLSVVNNMTERPDIVLTMGAGDIDTYLSSLKELFIQKYKLK